MRNLSLYLFFACTTLGLKAQNFPYFGLFQYNRPQINSAALPDMAYDYATPYNANLNVRTPIMDQQLPDYQGINFSSFQFNLNTAYLKRNCYQCHKFFFSGGLDAQSDNRGLNMENSRFSLRGQAVFKTYHSARDYNWLSIGINLTHSNLALKRSYDGFLFEDLSDPVLSNRSLSSNYLGAGAFFHSDYYYVGFSMPELLQFPNKSDQEALNNASINRTIHFLLGGKIGKNRQTSSDPFFVEIDSWLRFVPDIEFHQGNSLFHQFDASLMARANLGVLDELKVFTGVGGGSNLRAQGEVGLQYSWNGTIYRLSCLMDAGLNRGRTVPNLELNLSLGFP